MHKVPVETFFSNLLRQEVFSFFNYVIGTQYFAK
jgi:hypothetical protein